MKFFRKLAILSALPILSWASNFDSTVHLQAGTKWAEETSHIKFTGNFYDKISGTDAMWIISPKIYLHPSIPMDFAGSIGIKKPITGNHSLGYHAFGHFHNFGYFPINQYGHTLEWCHSSFEIKMNYYHRAKGVYPFSCGILSSHRMDGEISFKIPEAVVTLGPVYQFEDKRWGLLGRVTKVMEDMDVGLEVSKPPRGEPMASLFLTLKFPNKKQNRYEIKGNNSCHYTNLSIRGPTSYSSKNETIKKLEEKEL